MLLIPTKKQLEIIKEKGKGGDRNDLRIWLYKKRDRISEKLLKRYNINITKEQEVFIKLNLTEEQQEKIQGENLLNKIKQNII